MRASLHLLALSVFAAVHAEDIAAVTAEANHTEGNRSNEFGLAFLEENAKKPGVITLPSGLQYKVLKEGEGNAHPLKSSTCKCHYEGRTAQEYSKSPKGKVFDSSYERNDPSRFSPEGVIAGWGEAMQLMVEGDKWQLFIPAELAYGDSGSGMDIKGGDVLVFTLELVKIDGEWIFAEPRPPLPYTDLNGSPERFAEWEAAEAKAPARLLLVLKAPKRTSKLFQAYLQVAKSSVKSADGVAYAMSAASYFTRGKYTEDRLVNERKLSTPALYVRREADWMRCKIGRPTESTIDEIRKAIVACAKPSRKNKPKAEL